VIGARVAERVREPVVKQSNNLRRETRKVVSRRIFLHGSRKRVKEDTVDRSVFVARAAVSFDVT
jgi:hypothetical protein